MPRGFEAAAVRRARPAARIVEIAAGAAAASALPELQADEPVVVLGLCGGLRRELATGDVAVYTSVAGVGGAFELDPGLVAQLSAALPRAHVASACTTERVVTTAAARAVVAQRFGADVADMEGTHLAKLLRSRGQRFAMVRVVSDDASRDLPPLEDAVDAAGRVMPLRIAVAFGRAPRAAVAFLRGVRHALATLTDTTHTIGGLR